MSLFSWLFTPKAPKLAAESSWLSRLEPTRPAGKQADGAKSAGAPPAAGSRKSERMARREQLYSVVRESMVRAGVLSSRYKFKVLSLDSRGRQYMVMVDLAAGTADSTGQLAEVEAMIAQAAKSRHDIGVTAVYWRRNEHVASGDARRTSSRPAPLEGDADPVSSPVAKAVPPPSAPAAPSAAAVASGVPGYEPILPAEVAAFKRALSASTASAAAAAALAGPGHQPDGTQSFDGSAKRGPQSYTLLTGFEDTEEPDARVPALSGSQYGDLN